MTNITQTITSGGDDGYSSGSLFDSGSVATGNNGTACYGGWRFQGVAVPKGAAIASATLSARTWTGVGGGGTAWGNWYGEAADSSAAWSSASRPDQRTRTSASCPVLWSGADLAFNAHDVTAIVQEIVNRPGWASGNALSFVGDGIGNGLAIFHEIDNSGYATPLTITYTPPAAGGSTGRGGLLGPGFGAGSALIDDGSRALLMTQLLMPRSRGDAAQRCWANWLFDRTIYRGVKGKAGEYLGAKSEAQVYLGERKLF